MITPDFEKLKTFDIKSILSAIEMLNSALNGNTIDESFRNELIAAKKILKTELESRPTSDLIKALMNIIEE